MSFTLLDSKAVGNSEINMEPNGMPHILDSTCPNHVQVPCTRLWWWPLSETSSESTQPHSFWPNFLTFNSGIPSFLLSGDLKIYGMNLQWNGPVFKWNWTPSVTYVICNLCWKDFHVIVFVWTYCVKRTADYSILHYCNMQREIWIMV